MENKTKSIFIGGIEMAVNDMVEVISSSNPDLYGVVGEIKEINSGKYGTDLRIVNNNGIDVWIDAEDVVLT